MSEWIDDMNNTRGFEPGEADILSFEVSDESLEAAANATTGAAMSFVGAPTVSVLISCCSNDLPPKGNGSA